MYPYLVTIIVVLIVDFIWIYLNRNSYNYLVRKIQGTNIQLNFIGGAVSYIFIMTALFLFSIPMIKNEYKKNKNQSLLLLSMTYGGLLGLCIYGVFNTSNIGIFKNYDVYVAIMDTIWGFVIYTFAAYFLMTLLIKQKGVYL